MELMLKNKTIDRIEEVFDVFFKAIGRNKILYDKFKPVLEEGEVLFREYFEWWYNLMREAIIYGMERTMTKASAGRITTKIADWGCITSKGIKGMQPAYLSIMQNSGNKALEFARVEGAFDVYNKKAISFARKRAGNLVKEVTKETQKLINRTIADGIKQGKTLRDLQSDLKPIVGLHSRQVKAIQNYEKQLRRARLPDLEIKREIASYTRRQHSLRTETIARTENSVAQAEGTLQAYEQAGVEKVMFVASSDACPVCSEKDGKKYKLDESSGIIPVHPNCIPSPNTKIYTLGGWKRIKDVQIGDFVLTHKGRFRKVIQLHRNREFSPELVKIKINRNGEFSKLVVTGNHPVLVNGIWKEARDVKIGDKISYMMDCKENTSEKQEYKFYDFNIVELDTYFPKKTIPLFNLSVEEDKSYVAKGFVVHNCRCVWVAEGVAGTSSVSPIPDNIKKPRKPKLRTGGHPVSPFGEKEKVHDFAKNPYSEKEFNRVFEEYKKNLSKEYSRFVQKYGKDEGSRKFLYFLRIESRKGQHLDDFLPIIRTDFGVGVDKVNYFRRIFGESLNEVAVFMHPAVLNRVKKTKLSLRLKNGFGRGKYKSYHGLSLPSNGEMTLWTNSSNYETILHEFGHFFEDISTGHTGKYSRYWLRRRAKSKAKLKDITHDLSYRNDEQTWINDFIDAYVGKIYDNGSEVISMGFQQFLFGEDLVRFMNHDFDHFSYIMGVLNGVF